MDRFFRISCFSLFLFVLFTAICADKIEAAPGTGGVAFRGTETKSYRDHVGVIATPETAAELALVKANSIVLVDHPRPGADVPIVVSRQQQEALREVGVEMRIEREDLESAITTERGRLMSSSAVFGSFFDDFRSAMVIDEYLAELALDDSADIVNVGTSTEGRPIRGLRIGTGDATIVVTAGQHAREWIAPVVATCLADALVRERETAPEISELLARVTIVIVPLVNPDGYEYSRTSDRFWRKNRNGAGVDLNRNWDSMWGLGVSGSPSSEVYPGTSAFSEVETAAVRDLIVSLPNVIAFIDYHSPIASILYPFAYTSEPGPLGDESRSWAQEMADAITAVHNEPHDIRRPGVGNPSGGLAQDWTAGTRSIYSWTVELRGGAFTISPSEIRPACDENLAGFTTIASRVADNAGAVAPDGGAMGGADAGLDEGPTANGSGCSSSGRGGHLFAALLLLFLLASRSRFESE